MDLITQIKPPETLPDRITDPAQMKTICNDAAGFLVTVMGMPEDQALKEMGFAYQLFRKNKELMNCTPTSLYFALANVGNMGLTLNPTMKLAYLIPRSDKGRMECHLTPSYMGLIKLCTDPGGVLVIEAGLILEGDRYEIQLGSGGHIKHWPLDTIPRSEMSADQKELIKARNLNDGKFNSLAGQMVGVYSRAVLHNGAESIDWMPIERLLKIKKLMVKTKRDDAPANLWPDEFFKKTVIAHHTKTLPKSERTALAIDLFNRAEGVDMNNLPEHSERSIIGQLSTGHEANEDCPSCNNELVGGVCTNTDCKDSLGRPFA